MEHPSPVRKPIYHAPNNQAIHVQFGIKRSRAGGQTAYRLGTDMEGRTVIITGGASGIGRSVALLCAELGARVVVADLDREGAERVAQEALNGGPPSSTAQGRHNDGEEG